jgi:hypothetical protein
VRSDAMNSMNYQSAGEMGPVADMSIFPPRMAVTSTDETLGLLPMDSILSSDFWDSVLVPGMFPFWTMRNLLVH